MTGSNTSASIEVESLSKHYETGDGRVAALSDVDLSVPEGAFVSLLGPSGCGKTTLLRLIAGLEAPTSGTVRINGTPVRGPGSDRGLVFQDVTLFPWRTVAENVRFGLEVADTGSMRVDRRVDELLTMVGLGDRRDSYPETLSGGMAKRVGIARALAPDPAILLLDEPFADLDVGTRERLQADLLHIWRRLDKAVVLVTHTVGEAVRLSDQVLVMDGPPGQIETVVDVDLDRPRSHETDSYRSFVNPIRETLREQTEARRTAPTSHSLPEHAPSQQ